jgi:predicted  nucleic acid-binding Zn-ribbon protein
MSVDVEALKGELAAHKKRASDYSADNLRAQKTIGALQDELDKASAVRADNDQLAEEVKDLKSQVKALNAAVDAANKQAAANAVKVEAAEQIAAGLKAL